MTGGALLVAQAAGQASGLAAGQGAQPVPVPSGRMVTLQDVIWNETGPQGLTLRFRFVAPGLSRDDPALDYNMVQADMQALCDSYALPRIAEGGPRPAQVVISLASAPVPFGETAPEVTQFFEAYSVQDGTCQWEMF